MRMPRKKSKEKLKKIEKKPKSTTQESKDAVASSLESLDEEDNRKKIRTELILRIDNSEALKQYLSYIEYNWFRHDSKYSSLIKKDTINYPKFYNETRDFDSIVAYLMSKRLINRLKFINQLSSVPLTVNLGGRHCRLSHSLGVADTALVYITRIIKLYENNEIEGLDKAKDRELWDQMIIATITYAIIHDLFHGPFGHTLELIRKIFIQPSKQINPKKESEVMEIIHSKLDKYYLNLYLRKKEKQQQNSFLRDILSNIPGVQDSGRFIEILECFTNHGLFLIKYPKYYFLYEIFDSLFDADRIDYMLRDSLHLRHEGKTPTDYSEPIKEIKILEIEEKEIKYNTIHFHKKHIRSIGRFLEKRNEQYELFYESEKKIAFDETLCHCFYYALKHLGCLIDYNEPNAQIIQEKLEIINKLILLTDYELINLIQFIGRPCVYIEILINSLAGNTYQKLHSYKPLKYNELIKEFLSERGPNSVKRMLHLPQLIATKFDKKCIDEDINRDKNNYLEVVVKGIKESFSKDFTSFLNEAVIERDEELSKLNPLERKNIDKKELDELISHLSSDNRKKINESFLNALIYDFCYFMGNIVKDHSIKFSIETYIWKNLLLDNSIKKKIEKDFLTYINKDKIIRQEFLDYPQIFISFPPYTPDNTSDVLLSQREHSNTLIRTYNDEGIQPLEIIEIPHKETIESYKVILIGPDFLVKEKRIISKVIKLFEDFILKGIWCVIAHPIYGKDFIKNMDEFKLEKI